MVLLKTGKLAVKAYGAVSSAAHTIRHPIQATQDAIRNYLVGALVKLIVKAAGETAADALMRRVNRERTFQTTMAVPKPLRGVVLDADSLAFATQLMNDGLEVPLAALNLTLGRIEVRQAEEPGHLLVQGAFQVGSASEPKKLKLSNTGSA